MNKEYKYANVNIDEESGYISISENGSHKATYWIKSEEEKEILKNRYTGLAITHILSVLLSLTVPAAIMYFTVVSRTNGFKSALIMIGLSVIAAIIVYFAVIFLVSAIVGIFSFEKNMKEDKRLKPTIIITVIWLVIALAVSVFAS